MTAEARQFLPVLAAVGRAEERRILDACINRIRVGERRLEMPYPLELPWMRSAVVPQMRAKHAVIDELVSHRLPRLAAVVGALNELTEPAAGLGGIQAIRIGGRSLEVVNLPSAEKRSGHVPSCPLAIGGQYKRPFARPYQQTYSAHLVVLLCIVDPSLRKSTRDEPASMIR